jgi:hypothetical protein
MTEREYLLSVRQILEKGSSPYPPEILLEETNRRLQRGKRSTPKVSQNDNIPLILSLVTTEWQTASQIAASANLSPQYVGKVLTLFSSEGTIEKTPPKKGATPQYKRQQAAPAF